MSENSGVTYKVTYHYDRVPPKLVSAFLRMLVSFSSRMIQTTQWIAENKKY